MENPLNSPAPSELTGVSSSPSEARQKRHPFILWVLANVRWMWPILVVTAVVAASWTDLRAISYRQVRLALRNQDLFFLTLAAGITLLNLAVMGLYDVVCLRSTKVRILERWWVGSLAFAWSNFLTLGPLAGPAIRFWLYRPSGVSFGALREAILSIAIGFGTGLTAWLSAALMPLPDWGVPGLVVRVVTALILAGLAGALSFRVQRWKRFPIWIRELKVNWPALFALGVFDWLLAFLVFSLVLRADGIVVSGSSALRVFFWGQGIGLASLIPGGLGSADAFWLSRLNSLAGRGAAALLVYRMVYYFLPWIAATLFLLRRAVHGKVRWAGPARLFVSLAVMISSWVILISSATPGLARRMRILREFVPLPILETSHIASALIGLLVFVLARRLMKGYRHAYQTTLQLLLVGAAFNLLKGLDYEEAIVLTLTAALLWIHSELFTLPSRAGGTAVSILIPLSIAILAFAAVGLTAYHEPGTRAQHILTFAHLAYSARFLRTLSILILAGLLIAIYVIVRIPYRYTPPTTAEIRKALEVHREVGRGTNALMLTNRDKCIHFWEDRGFCLYRTIGSYMIVFSDPSIPAGEERNFIGCLLQRAAELDRALVFYQISAHWIPVLHDFGFSFFKLGEEAIVHLDKHSIQGNKGKAMRNVLNRFRNDGYEFQVLEAEEIAPLMEKLRRISDEWLRSKRTREKQFSIGFFDPGYLTSFPCAIVRDRSGEVVAFANILPGPANEEFSVDLMRYLPECPNGVMDFLFLRLFEWGKSRNYRTFNLGMAPLATVGETPQARLPERLANILFQHGEHWYNFRGLRLFKEKFDPTWIPRYLAYPSFWMLPQVIANVAAMIAGGWRNVIFPVAQEPATERPAAARD